MDSPLQNLRIYLKKLKIDAVILHNTDSHNSEYVSNYDKRIQFLSKFSGTNATIVITENHAGLFTDGRYFTQFGIECDRSDWELIKMGVEGSLGVVDYLKQCLCNDDDDFEQDGQEKQIYLDQNLLMTDQFYHLETEIKSILKNASIYSDINNPTLRPIDEIWNKSGSRPQRKNNFIKALPLEYSGQSWVDKVSKLKDKMRTLPDVRYCILSSLDDIAWLFNLRGSDIDYNPLFFSYAIIRTNKFDSPSNEIYLFVQNPEKTRQELIKQNDSYSIVSFLDYDEFNTKLGQLSEKLIQSNKKFWVDSSLNYASFSKINENQIFMTTNSEVRMTKMRKNEVELKNIGKANLKAALALSKFLSQVENNFIKGVHMDEFRLTKVLENFYKLEDPDNFYGMSFKSNISSNSNAAKPHYKCSEQNFDKITAGIFLTDNGAHYIDGTTDTTRVLWLENSNSKSNLNLQFVKKMYTLVLLGHICIRLAKFPKGTKGYQIDTLARMHLWQDLADFGHGTGHGIGSFLNVHEGPIGLYIANKEAVVKNTLFLSNSSKKLSHQIYENDKIVGHLNQVYLKPNSILSNEPGYYQPDQFGIRIENAVVVQEIGQDDHKPYYPNAKFCQLEDLIFLPHCRKLIDVEILRRHVEEYSYLNMYHERCREILVPLLEDFPEAKEWVLENTRPL